MEGAWRGGIICGVNPWDRVPNSHVHDQSLWGEAWNWCAVPK